MPVAVDLDERQNDLAPRFVLLGVVPQDALGDLADAIGLGRRGTQRASEVASGFERAVAALAEVRRQDERLGESRAADEERLQRLQHGLP